MMRRGSSEIVVQTDFGLSIEFDGFWVGLVKIPASLVGVTDGLCGNHNNDPDDDFTTSQGVDVSLDPDRQSLLGNSYQIDDIEAPE